MHPHIDDLRETHIVGVSQSVMNDTGQLMGAVINHVEVGPKGGQTYDILQDTITQYSVIWSMQLHPLASTYDSKMLQHLP